MQPSTSLKRQILAALLLAPLLIAAGTQARATQLSDTAPSQPPDPIANAQGFPPPLPNDLGAVPSPAPGLPPFHGDFINKPGFEIDQGPGPGPGPEPGFDPAFHPDGNNNHNPPPRGGDRPKLMPPLVPNNIGFVFPFQIAVLVIVIVPLLLVRRFESPRRRLSVWFFDLGRLVVGYALAEVLLMVFLVPYAALVNSYKGPPAPWNQNRNRPWRVGNDNYGGQAQRGVPPDTHISVGGPGSPDVSFDRPALLLRRAAEASAEILGNAASSLLRRTNNNPNPNTASNFDASSDRKARHFENDDKRKKHFIIRLETTSLTLSLIEVFPGLFFIYGTYFCFLYIVYRLKLVWLQHNKRIRYVRDSRRRRRNHSPDGELEGDSDAAESNSSSFLALRDSRFSKILSQTDAGLTSGNYGHPVRISWFFQQASLFALSVFLIRITLFFICAKYSDATEALRRAVFGWIHDIDSWPAIKLITLVALPSVIYTIQFVLTDYFLKYKSSVSKRNLFFNVPSYSYGDDLNSGTHYPESFELQELSLPRPFDDRTTTSTGNQEPRLVNHTIATVEIGRSTSTSLSPTPVVPTRGFASIHNEDTEDDDADVWAPPSAISTASATTLRSAGASTPAEGQQTLRTRNAVRSVSAPLNIEGSLEAEIEETVSDLREIGAQAWAKVTKTQKEATAHLSSAISSATGPEGLPRLGLVTATLLNSVAANATATARPYIFNGGVGRMGVAGSSIFSNRSLSTSSLRSPFDLPAPTTPITETGHLPTRGDAAAVATPTATSSGTFGSASESSSVSAAFRLDQLDDEDAPPDGLPSYDDSQRQHQELLRDRGLTERRNRQIDDLKRRGAPSSSNVANSANDE